MSAVSWAPPSPPRTPALRLLAEATHYALRPALDATFDQFPRIRRRAALPGMRPIVVHRPAARTLRALVGVLAFVDLVTVAAMYLGLGRNSRVFVVPQLPTVPEKDVIAALVYSGASRVTMTVKVPR